MSRNDGDHSKLFTMYFFSSSKSHRSFVKLNSIRICTKLMQIYRHALLYTFIEYSTLVNFSSEPDLCTRSESTFNLPSWLQLCTNCRFSNTVSQQWLLRRGEFSSFSLSPQISRSARLAEIIQERKRYTSTFG